MKSPQQIRDLADQRLREAKVLCKAGEYDGAFYLAGYCVELELKAKCCERLGIPNLFDEEDKIANSISGIGDIRKLLKTHKINVLLVLSGLKNEFDEKGAEDQTFLHAKSLLLSEWSESCRYKPCGYCKPKDAKKFIDYIEEKNGLLEWIRQH